MISSGLPSTPRRRPGRSLVGRFVVGVVVALVLTGGGVLPTPAGSSPAVADGAPATHPMVPVSPTRILDTRTTNQPFGPGETRTLSVPYSSAVGPAGTVGYALNITVVDPTAATHLSVGAYEPGVPAPSTSVLNVRAGETRAAFAVTRTARISPFIADWFVLRNAAGTAHVLVDVVAYVGPTAYSNTDLVTTFPTRLVDTRKGLGAPKARLGPGQSLTVSVGDVPLANAALVNITAVAPSQTTHLTAWRTGDPRPAVSSLNARAGEVTPNLVLSRLDAQKRFTIRNNSGTTDVVVDLVGLVTTSNASRVGLIPPVRLLDTRTAGPITAGGTRQVLATAAPGVPDDVDAVLVTVTLVAPTEATHLTVWKYGTPTPSVSTVNAAAGQTVANTTLVGVGDVAPLVTVANHAGSAHVLVDVVGWLRY